MVYLFIKFFELGHIVFGMSTIWEDTNVCVKQYRCAIEVYSMNVLSYLYGIILDDKN